MTTLRVERFVWKYLDSNMYLVTCGNNILVIDPVECDEALQRCKEASSITVLLTHEHYDHICGLNRLRELCLQKKETNEEPNKWEYWPLSIKDYGISEMIVDGRKNCYTDNGKGNSTCLVIASKACSERIQDNKANMSMYAVVMTEISGRLVPEHWLPFSCQRVDIEFINGCTFRWMGHSVECFSTPGHSVGSSSINIDDVLFVGDSILESDLMVKFPGSSKKIYQNFTIPLLKKKLPKVSLVFPGHGEIMKSEKALELIQKV